MSEQSRFTKVKQLAMFCFIMGVQLIDKRPGADRLRKQVERSTEQLLPGRWSELLR
jgi:hypothetical protein